MLRRNAAALGLAGAQVRVAPAAAVLAMPAERAYDVVLVDPPYDVPAAEVAGWLAAAAANGWIAAGAVVVVERSARGGRSASPRRCASAAYGETLLHLAPYTADPPTLRRAAQKSEYWVLHIGCMRHQARSVGRWNAGGGAWPSAPL